MLQQLNSIKENVAKLIALTVRHGKTIEQRQLALDEDMAARQKLMDPSLPSDQFTTITNQARAAQRRRANLHDKAIEIEEAVRKLAQDIQTTAGVVLTMPMPVPTPADAAAQADAEFLEPTPVAEVEEGFVEISDEEEAA